MGLLKEIQDAASDRSAPLSDLLRKCLKLAYHLGNPAFREWVENELNGYPPDAPLPSYRGGLSGQVRATLAGPFGSGYKNLPVPLSSFPANVRDVLTAFQFGEGVGRLESLEADARSSGSMLLRMIPPELFANVGIIAGYSTIAMSSELPVSALTGILDQIRTRALKFALEIEAVNPEAGEARIGSEPVPSERVTQIFNTVITGGNVSFAPASMGATQTIQAQVIAGDFESLARYLKSNGVEDPELAELGTITKTGPKGTRASRIERWAARVAKRLATAVSGIGEDMVVKLITAAISRYLGGG